jgi:hypothetical protein
LVPLSIAACFSLAPLAWAAGTTSPGANSVFVSASNLTLPAGTASLLTGTITKGKAKTVVAVEGMLTGIDEAESLLEIAKKPNLLGICRDEEFLIGAHTEEQDQFRITRADPSERRQPVEPSFSRVDAPLQRLTRLRSGHDRARHSGRNRRIRCRARPTVWQTSYLPGCLPLTTERGAAVPRHNRALAASSPRPRWPGRRPCGRRFGGSTFPLSSTQIDPDVASFMMITFGSRGVTSGRVASPAPGGIPPRVPICREGRRRAGAKR